MIPRALTIAGSDSGGGAGIQADLKTFTELGIYGMTVITAITAQNTLGVSLIQEVEMTMIRAQIDQVITDIGCDAAKTGMLSSATVIEGVSSAIRTHRISKLVVDPVMVAKSGDRLLKADAIGALRTYLLPLAMVVTPNLPEAEVIVAHPIKSESEMVAAARELLKLGPAAVLLKGGHSAGNSSDDLYLDDMGPLWLRSARVDTRHTHGSGCTLSAAIAAYLALGSEPRQAAAAAKDFIGKAIVAALPLGSGHGPVNPAFSHIRPGLH